MGRRGFPRSPGARRGLAWGPGTLLPEGCGLQGYGEALAWLGACVHGVLAPAGSTRPSASASVSTTCLQGAQPLASGGGGVSPRAGRGAYPLTACLGQSVWMHGQGGPDGHCRRLGVGPPARTFRAGSRAFAVCTDGLFLQAKS